MDYGAGTCCEPDLITRFLPNSSKGLWVVGFWGSVIPP